VNPLLRATAIVAMLAAACSPPAPASEERDEGVQEIVVTQESGEGPDSCTPGAVGEVVVRFLHAINTGADVTEFIASDFQWYSMTEGNPRKDGRHFVAYSVEDLRDYVERRASHDESIKLLQLSMNHDSTRDINHLQIVFERTSDDTARFGTRGHGKGAFNCDEQKIMVLSLGMAPNINDGMARLCPESKDTPSSVALVCNS
jgi:hypothetical protein